MRLILAAAIILGAACAPDLHGPADVTVCSGEPWRCEPDAEPDEPVEPDGPVDER